jgi:dethiobiotin synthetase
LVENAGRPLTAAQIEGVNIDIEYLLGVFRKFTARVDLILVEELAVGWSRSDRTIL